MGIEFDNNIKSAEPITVKTNKPPTMIEVLEQINRIELKLSILRDAIDLQSFGRFNKITVLDKIQEFDAVK